MTTSTTPQNKTLKEKIPGLLGGLGSILFWLLIWQVLSLKIDNVILLSGPAETLRALASLLPQASFLRAVLFSLSRILAGFFLAFAAASLLAAASHRFPALRRLLSPLLTFVKATPVAAFVIIVLLWVGSANLSVVISFLIVFPVLYAALLEGFSQVDPALTEMARVFRVPAPRRFFHIVLPALRPSVMGAVKSSYGMAVKSGVAAEVIGLPGGSIGERLYMAKITLSTPELFAWVVTILIAGTLTEKAVTALIRFLTRTRKMPFGASSPAPAAAAPVRADALSVSFHGRPVLKDLSLSLLPGSRTALMAPSGTGKTTLLRALCGLQAPDHGTADAGGQAFGVQFQEDRLLTEENALANLAFVCQNKSRDELAAAAGELIPDADLTVPVREWSGGMKRRLSLLRALLSPSPILLLDEPFTGLDAEARKEAVRVILREGKGRTVLVVTHDPDDAALLHAETLTL